MWNFLSSLVSWIPAVIKAMSRNKKLDSAIDRVEKLEKIKLKPEDPEDTADTRPIRIAPDKWVAKRSEKIK